VLLYLQLDLCFILLNRNFSQGHKQLDKDSLPHIVKGFNTPLISRLLRLGIRVFRGPKLPKAHIKLIVGATTMVKREITPTDAPIDTHANQPTIATPAPTHGANFVLVAAKQNYACGRVNHVVVEEAQQAPDVVIDMFLVNDTSAVVLFDSVA
jgi:hypothetical protein